MFRFDLKTLKNYTSLDIIIYQYAVVGFIPIEEEKNKLLVNAKEKIMHTFIKKEKRKAKSSPTSFDKELSLTFGYHFLNDTALLSQGHLNKKSMQKLLNA